MFGVDESRGTKLKQITEKNKSKQLNKWNGSQASFGGFFISSLCGYTKFSEIPNLPMQNKHLSQKIQPNGVRCVSIQPPKHDLSIVWDGHTDIPNDR